MRYFSFLCLWGLVFAANAQKNIIESLETAQVGQGNVSVFQDEKITNLIGNIFDKSALPSGESATLKLRGYRIQLYAGNNSKQARNEANDVAERFRESYPNMGVYTYFRPPRWLCRVGDFRSIEEADAMMRQLKATGRFKEISIVREQIIIPIE